MEDLETVCQIKLDFDEAAQDEQLRLNLAGLLFQFFRQCLRGQAQINWDAARAGQPIAMAGYRATIEAYFGMFFMNNDLPDQVHWLQEQSKSQGVSVVAFVA